MLIRSLRTKPHAAAGALHGHAHHRDRLHRAAALTAGPPPPTDSPARVRTLPTSAHPEPHCHVGCLVLLVLWSKQAPSWALARCGSVTARLARWVAPNDRSRRQVGDGLRAYENKLDMFDNPVIQSWDPDA